MPNLVNAMAATRTINLLNRATANTKAAAETVETPVIVTATRVMVHSPAIITVTNSMATTGAMMATEATAAIAIIATTRGVATGMAGIVLTATIIAVDVNTGATAAFGAGSSMQ